MIPKHELATTYFARCQRDGRAVIQYSPWPDDSGDAQPRLWLCMVGQQLFACDDAGPDSDGPDAIDEGFLLGVPAVATIAQVQHKWKDHKDEMLADRKRRRDSLRLGRRKTAYVYGKTLAS